MKKLLSLIFNRWVLITVALLCVALVVWIVGPLVAIGQARPLDTERARWITIGCIVLIVAAVLGWKAWRARQGNAAVVNQLVAAPADKKQADSADLVAVRERFERALATLRRARFGGGGLLAGWRARLGGRYLYELPWYLIIGAPGSGKTTALQNCGLKFPLADKVGDHAVRGVGGTRNCDWWFTDQAVLIDTAGRFTTQDSDRENDRATWGGFLAMLKKARPRQPLNGVLVTVSVIDLLTRTPAERAQHAATVRQRVQELHEDLGIRFPIYLLVTKCDLVAGFMDYFATVDKEQRATPWGFTFGLDEATEQGLQRLGAEFDALLQRLTDGLIDRVQTERDAQRRSRIYAFPSQFAAVRPVLQEFADTVFSPSRFEANPLLRGMYFVSGTQEGTPIDRVLGSIARGYGLERAILAPNQSSGKSYFLARLLGEVVFAESGIAGINRKWERQRRIAVIAGYASIGVFTLTLIALWSVSWFNNRAYITDVATRVEELRKLVQATPNRASAELLPVVPALEATRSLAQPRGSDSVPWSLGFGLYQGKKLDSAARHAYERMLLDAVRPRLALRIEDQLRVGGAAQESLYEALKAYLMLYDADHLDVEALKHYIEADWDSQGGRDIAGDQREALGRHIDALLDLGAAASPLPQDPALVASTRAQLTSVALPQRVYNRMRHRGLGKDFPEFSVAAKGGNNAALVFERSSGAPLTQGVPGLYSYDGYHRGFQAEVGRVVDQLVDEQGWVLGVAEPARRPGAGLLSDKLADDVRRLYLADYVTVWDAFIADIRLQPMKSVSQSVQITRLLSAPDGPLPLLLRAISRETTLGSGKTLADQASLRVSDVIKKGTKILESKVGVNADAAPDAGSRIESIVDDHFKALRDFVSAPEGGKAPIDNTIALIGEAYVMLNAADTALKGGAAPPLSPVPAKLKNEAPLLPEPARSLMDNIAQAGAKVTTIQLRENLSREVRSQVGEFCQQAVAGRYPLDRNARRDVTAADFALLFGPGGKIDQLFQSKLAPYVDTSTRPWRFRAVEGTPLGSDLGTLPQFQRAATIRETFFPAGASAPQLHLDFKPVEMDPKIAQFILDVDGQVVRYAHGPQIATPVQWPGPRGSGSVRAQVSPPGANTSGMVNDGPWALFRMFERVSIDKGSSPERFRASFDFEGRKAQFEITTSSVRNPFRLEDLAEFRCPMGL